MNRRRIFAIAFVAVVAVALAMIWPATSRSGQPAFVPATSDLKIPRYRRISYEFLLPAPFEGGLVWIYTLAQRHPREFLFDIEQKKVVGGMVQGWPQFGNRDQSKILMQIDAPSLRGRVLSWLERLTRGLFRANSNYREESFYIYDRNRNTGREVGRVYQSRGGGSGWYPSPNCRYGFNRPTASARDEVFLCDLEKQSMKTIEIKGYPAGWWDNSNILYQSAGHDFSLYDVVRNRSFTLLSAETIQNFLREHQLNVKSANGDFSLCAMGYGKEYQFYFTDTHNRWLATNSFLARLDRPGKLTFITNDFKFEWADSFDPTGRYYLYSGRDAAAGDKVGAVFVRDMETGTVRTLVPDSADGQHSIPRWYGNSVIFCRSNSLWRIGLTETNATCLFPPPE